MKPVHGNRQCLVSLLGDGAVAHGSRLKASDNGIHALHLVQRDALFRKVEVHQPPQILDGILIIDQCGIFFKHLIVSTPGGLLEKMNGRRIIEVFVRSASHLVMSQAV